MPESTPTPQFPNTRALPRWLKRNVPKGGAGHFTADLVGRLGLQTVCDHAKCPNRMECYSRKTATFMILGDICTRGCRFCSVKKGKPSPPDADEPRRVAEAVHRLGLKHVVITCVTRDDLPDGGAAHFARTIEEIRSGKEISGGLSQFSSDENGTVPFGSTTVIDSPVPRSGNRETETGDRGFDAGGRRTKISTDFRSLPTEPRTPNLEPCLPTIEVLPSDFAGNTAAVDRLVEAAPEVYNHNVETVPRLFPAVRDPRTNYRWTLEMFRRINAANPAIALKSGMMLGLGETTDELLEVWADLLDAGCRMLTIGQYLQPSPAQTPVVRYVPPEEFDLLGERARQIGFEQVAAGPFVRSSYHAGEMLSSRDSYTVRGPN